MNEGTDSVTALVRQRLAELKDPAYRTFIAKLVPTLAIERIIGVRTPAMRKLGASLRAEGVDRAFLAVLPHDLYEENSLHTFLLNRLRDPDEAFRLLEVFLPHVDNWAVCDSISPEAFDSDPLPLIHRVPGWLASDHPYTQRYAIGVLMRYCLDGRFDPSHLTLVGLHKSSEYYVNMMRAWYFSMALVKQWDAALPWLTERRMDPWTHRMTIRKAVESFQIPQERKAYLKGLR